MEKDVTGLAVDRASQVLARVRKAFNVRVPYGPSRAKMTPKEARTLIQNMSPEAKSRMMSSMGTEQWAKLMAELYHVS